MKPKNKTITWLLMCIVFLLVIAAVVFFHRKKPETVCGTYSMMLTDEEKEFLVFNCVDEDATKEQIAKGTLPEWKRALVYWHRQVMEHLTSRYPEQNFTITTYENITDSLTKFYVMVGEDENTVFTVTVDKDSGQITDTHSSGGSGESLPTDSIAEQLMDKYGLTPDELHGLDLDTLERDYNFLTNDYSAEEIRQILAEQGSYYMDTDHGIYDLLKAEPAQKVTLDSRIRRIGLDYNEGSYYTRLVIDLDKQEYYRDNNPAQALTEEQREQLLGIVKEYAIDQWQTVYIGDEEDTTGFLAWRLVFELQDGSDCVYCGETRNMTSLPDTFGEVTDVLFGIAK